MQNKIPFQCKFCIIVNSDFHQGFFKVVLLGISKYAVTHSSKVVVLQKELKLCSLLCSAVKPLSLWPSWGMGSERWQMLTLSSLFQEQMLLFLPFLSFCSHMRNIGSSLGCVLVLHVSCVLLYQVQTVWSQLSLNPRHPKD